MSRRLALLQVVAQQFLLATRARLRKRRVRFRRADVIRQVFLGGHWRQTTPVPALTGLNRSLKNVKVISLQIYFSLQQSRQESHYRREKPEIKSEMSRKMK